MKKTVFSPIIPVLAAVVVRQKTVLIARRNPEKHHGGFWEFPGGKLGIGETPEEGLKREISEELGVDIAVHEPLHLVNYQYPGQNILLIAYRCTLLSEDWMLTDHDKINWVKFADLRNYQFTGADLAIVARLLNH